MLFAVLVFFSYCCSIVQEPVNREEYSRVCIDNLEAKDKLSLTQAEIETFQEESMNRRHCQFFGELLRFGLIAGDCGKWFLPRIIGLARAKEILFTANPEKALQWGLVSDVVSESRLFEVAKAMAQNIADLQQLDDHQEAINSILEKRKPTFTGT